MDSVEEQRTCVKFCFIVGKTAAEIHSRFCEAYGDDALSQTTTSEWFKHFTGGRTFMDDD
jgi:hypothetical protein